MSRTKLEKNPGMLCGFTWGGTPDLSPHDSGWSCPHSCRLPYRHGADFHYCCGSGDGSHDA